MVFDAGVGELFVVRVAGNVVEGTGVTVKGSIEYAIAELNVPLVVVLGHTNCGAVKSAVKHIEQNDSLPGAINGLVELIKPVVKNCAGSARGNLRRCHCGKRTSGSHKIEDLATHSCSTRKSGNRKGCWRRL